MSSTRATPAPGVPHANQLISEAFIYAFCDRLLPLIPSSVRPNQVTLVGLGFGTLAALGYGLAGVWRGWLIFGIAAHLVFWVCDNMDGTLARRRGLTSVRGFFLDLTLDQVSYMLIYLGLSISGVLLLPIAAGAAVVHLLHVHMIDMWIYLRGEEHFGKFGPTELTLVITTSALVSFFWPGALVTLVGVPLSWFDIVGLVMIAVAIIEFVRSLLLLVGQLPGPR